MKIGIISLGCAKNLVDSELFLGLCQKYNLEITNNIDDSDIICVNTCGFIDSAKLESIDTILDLENYHLKGKIVIAMGCLVERYKENLISEIDFVDYYVPIRDYDKFDEIFKEITNSKESYKFSYTSRVISTGSTSAYLRIGDGCDNKCSYCAIPLIRGAYRSRPIEDILNEAKYLASLGIKEITIISQDTSKYGIDLKDVNLSILLDKLALMNLFKTIRVLYLYPDEITDELIDTFVKHDSIVNYFDIPIQHASFKLLKRMNRRGSKETVRELVNKIRSKMSDAIIRTTLIIGFPGETYKDHEELKEFISEIRFERLGAFTYSDEEGTKSYTMDKKVSEKTKNKRYNEIIEIQNEIATAFNKSRVGKVYEVLVESYDENMLMFKTRSIYEAPDDADGYIYVKSDKQLNIGDIYKVEITDYFTYELKAKIKD